MSTWSPKPTASSEFFSVDFARMLARGDSIISASPCTLSVMEGSDPSPSSMLVGAPIVNGTIVSQEVQGGVPGTRYQLRFAVLTAFGETLSFAGDFWTSLT